MALLDCALLDSTASTSLRAQTQGKEGGRKVHKTGINEISAENLYTTHDTGMIKQTSGKRLETQSQRIC